jgi:hypothetical protein
LSTKDTAVLISNSLLALSNARELIKIKNIFMESNINCLLLKGLALELILHGSIGKRESRDIDLLMKVSDTKMADYMLLREGYTCIKPKFDLTDRQLSEFRKKYHEAEYYHPEKNILIELHWRFTYDDFYYYDWENNEPYYIKLGAEEIRTLPPEEMFIYTVIHGAGHFFFRLKWLRDLEDFMPLLPEMDILYLTQRIKDSGFERIFKYSAEMLEIFMGKRDLYSYFPFLAETKIPKAIIDYSVKIIKAGAVPERCIKIILTELYFSLLLRWNNKSVKNMFATIFINYTDWNRIKLPDRLFFLYYPLRPVNYILSKLK